MSLVSPFSSIFPVSPVSQNFAYVSFAFLSRPCLPLSSQLDCENHLRFLRYEIEKGLRVVGGGHPLYRGGQTDSATAEARFDALPPFFLRNVFFIYIL